MALYELRMYTLRVGAMPEAVKLYQELGFPALQKGGQDKKLVGYFQADIGTPLRPGLPTRFRCRGSGEREGLSQRRIRHVACKEVAGHLGHPDHGIDSGLCTDGCVPRYVESDSPFGTCPTRLVGRKARIGRFGQGECDR